MPFEMNPPLRPLAPAAMLRASNTRTRAPARASQSAVALLVQRGRRRRELLAFQHAHDKRARFRQLRIGKADVHDGLSPLLDRFGRDAARARPRG